MGFSESTYICGLGKALAESTYTWFGYGFLRRVLTCFEYGFFNSIDTWLGCGFSGEYLHMIWVQVSAESTYTWFGYGFLKSIDTWLDYGFSGEYLHMIWVQVSAESTYTWFRYGFLWSFGAKLLHCIVVFLLIFCHEHFKWTASLCRTKEPWSEPRTNGRSYMRSTVEPLFYGQSIGRPLFQCQNIWWRIPLYLLFFWVATSLIRSK